MSDDFIPREAAEQALVKFLSFTSKAGFVFLRGRRRVGKSRLLQHVSQRNKGHCFIFSGVLDESGQQAVSRFADAWDTFTSTRKLTRLAKNELNWSSVFETIIEDLRAMSRRENISIWLFIDEVQWIAKGRLGFIGLFKNAWLQLEQITGLKIIFCGSSNKFFADNTGGEEKILRGLITHADIWLKPLSVAEVARYYGRGKLSAEESIFLYLCFGGIPYYLNQLSFDQGLIRALNDGAFMAASIFRQEAHELLRLDFNERGYRAALRLFCAWRSRVTSQTLLQKHSRLADSTLSELIDKLVLYGFVNELESTSGAKQTRKGAMLTYHDYFLRFYCRVVRRVEPKIARNVDGNIFSQLLGDNQNLSIANFSGEAFENLISCQIEELSPNHPFMRALGFSDRDRVIIADSRSDIVVRCAEERLMYFIECKWCHHQQLLHEGIEQLVSIRSEPDGWHVRRILVTNLEPTSATNVKATAAGITMVSAFLLLREEQALTN